MLKTFAKLTFGVVALSAATSFGTSQEAWLKLAGDWLRLADDADLREKPR